MNYLDSTPDGITTHTSSTDGTVYLRTQHGQSAREIADALRPYVGRRMRAYLPNNYGHYKGYAVTLLSVDSDNVTVQPFQIPEPVTVDAFKAFGSQCTTIQPEARGAVSGTTP